MVPQARRMDGCRDVFHFLADRERAAQRDGACGSRARPPAYGSLDVFGEYAGTFPSRGGPSHVLDFGTAYKLTRNQQIDLRGGTGLSRSR